MEECADCGIHRSVAPLYRTNPKGDKGIFKCELCMKGNPDPLVRGIGEIIVGGEMD